jgi:hypothetical protein
MGKTRLQPTYDTLYALSLQLPAMLLLRLAGAPGCRCLLCASNWYWGGAGGNNNFQLLRPVVSAYRGCWALCAC